MDVANVRQIPHIARRHFMNLFIPGQRWISESEPELGLGTVVQTENGRVQVEFKAAGEMRNYTVDQAPLKRVQIGRASCRERV